MEDVPQWRQLVEQSPDFVLRVEPSGRIDYINRTVPALCPADVVGTSVLDWVDVSDKASVEHALTRAFTTGEPGRFDFLSVPIGGQQAVWDIRLQPVVIDGRVVAAILTSNGLIPGRERPVVARDASRPDQTAQISTWSAFADQLTETIERAAPDKRHVVVMHGELRIFQATYFRLGPALADRIIQAAVERLRPELRSADLCVRLGASQFGLIIETDLKTESARGIAERVLATCTEPANVDQFDASVQGNIGVAIYPDAAGEADGLLAGAAHALVRAKAAGIDAIEVAPTSS